MSITILIGAQRLLQQKIFSSRTQRLQILIKVHCEENNEWNVLFTKYFECPLSTKQDFLCLCIYQLLSWVNKRVFNFYNEDIFPPRGKKLNNIYHGVRCQQQRSLKLRTKFTMDTYLVRSAQHNWQFLNRTLVLALGNIAEGVM